jgi:hypothetical protein
MLSTRTGREPEAATLGAWGTRGPAIAVERVVLAVLATGRDMLNGQYWGMRGDRVTSRDNLSRK